MIPDADSVKLLHTKIGEVAYVCDTNLIVCGTLGLANSYMIYPKLSKVNNIILGIWTRIQLEVVNKNESILCLLELAKSETASADFLAFFLHFFRCSNISVGTNVERTVKSSPNAESTVGKFLT